MENEQQPEETSTEVLDAEALSSLFEGVTEKPDGEGYTALCPAHGDSNASLWFTDGDYRTVVRCSATCSEEEVMAAIGKSVKDLARGSGEPGEASNPYARPGSEARDDLRNLQSGLTNREILQFSKDELTDPAHPAGAYLSARFAQDEIEDLIHRGLIRYRPDRRQIAFLYGDGSDRTDYRCVQYRSTDPEAGTRWFSQPGDKAVVGVSRIGRKDMPIVVTEGLSDGLAATLSAPQEWGVAVVRGAGQSQAMHEVVSLFGFDRTIILVCDFDKGGNEFYERNSRLLQNWGIAGIAMRPRDDELLIGDEKPVKDITDYRVQYGQDATRSLFARAHSEAESLIKQIEKDSRESAFAHEERIDDVTIERLFFMHHHDLFGVDEIGMPLISSGTTWAEVTEKHIYNALTSWIKREIDILDDERAELAEQRRTQNVTSSDEVWGDMDGLDDDDGDSVSSVAIDQRIKFLKKRAGELNAVRNLGRGKALSKAIIEEIAVKAASGQEDSINVSRLSGGPGIIAAGNGSQVVDLKTGDLDVSRSAAEAGCQAHTPVPWQGIDAKASEWESFLERALPDENVRLAFQEAVGYAAVGIPTQNIAWILVGEGGTGKTTVLEYVAKALGHYATMIDDDLLRNKAHESESASLIGTRFAFLSDGTSGIISSDSLKKYASAGTVKTRKLYGNTFTFQSQHVLFLQTNFEPRFDRYDSGTLRRIITINFDQPFDASKDTNTESLEVRLDREMPGILAWIVRGARSYFENNQNLVYNHVLLERTTEAINENDPHREFLSRCAAEAEGSEREFLTNETLRTIWQECYPDDRNDSSASGKFAAILRGRGWMPVRSASERGYEPPSPGATNPTYRRIKAAAIERLGNEAVGLDDEEEVEAANEEPFDGLADWNELLAKANVQVTEDNLDAVSAALHHVVTTVFPDMPLSTERASWLSGRLGDDIDPDATLVGKFAAAIATG